MSRPKDKLIDEMDSFARSLLAEVNVPGADIRDKVTVFKELTRFAALKHKVELPGDEEGSGINDYRRLIGGDSGRTRRTRSADDATAETEGGRKRRSKLPAAPDSPEAFDASTLAEGLNPFGGFSGNRADSGGAVPSPALADGGVRPRSGGNGAAVVDRVGDHGDVLPSDSDSSGMD